MLSSTICSGGKKSSNKHPASTFVPKQLSILKLCSDNNVEQLTVPKTKQTLIRTYVYLFYAVCNINNNFLVYILLCSPHLVFRFFRNFKFNFFNIIQGLYCYCVFSVLKIAYSKSSCLKNPLVLSYSYLLLISVSGSFIFSEKFSSLLENFPEPKMLFEYF